MAKYAGSLGGVLVGCLLVFRAVGVAGGQQPRRLILPEQRRMAIRDPSRLPIARLPDVPSPATVSRPKPDAEAQYLSLDEAIRTALANSEVVRLLAGVTATSSGRTIYDPAVANTAVDQARARFDPEIQVQNDFNRRETPQAGLAPLHPSGAVIGGEPIQDYEMRMGLSKTTSRGGSLGLSVLANPARTTAGRTLPLNPESRSALELSYVQPLLQGAGRGPNLAPIVIARIDTERSFFQLKDSLQGLLLGVIEAYWALVFARTDEWARQQQVEQGRWALEFNQAKAAVGDRSLADVAQARAALANFQASLITARANVLQREAALRNILGLPPSQPPRIVPVTAPLSERLEISWENLLRLAEQQRPDLIERKLILEADEQRLLLARNQALPRVDASMVYRWDGLSGTTPARTPISSGAGEFTGWTLGVTFSVPLGLRESRANLRQEELILMRDRANLQEGLHEAAHLLATAYRNLDQYYAQYLAFRETRAAARANLDVQSARYRISVREALYLNVLQAIADWGNAVSSEAQALAEYNIELANLERQTGTILQTHGVRLFEERYGSIGPLGRLFAARCYPRDICPGPNAERYPAGTEPAERSFRLEPPVPPRRAPAGSGPRPPQSPPAGRLQIRIPERVPKPVPAPAGAP